MLIAQCDDIAINAVAGNLTGFAPLFVVSGIHDVGTVKGARPVQYAPDLTWSGISGNETDHYSKRFSCVNRFAELFGGKWPVPNARYRAVPLGTVA